MRAETKITVDYIGEAIEDPRIPVTYALLDLLGANVPEDDLKAFVDALVPLELDEEEALEPETEELEH